MIAKNDFIELEFTARIKDGEVFDTNIESEAKKAKFDTKNIKQLIIAVGANMVIKGLDKALEGKELDKEYSLNLSPDDAFGKRDPGLVKTIPIKAFEQQKIYPQKGAQLVIDGMLVKIVSVSGGRVLVDFNNPLSGKIVVYQFKIKRKVEDIGEKINTLQDFFFKQHFDFSVKEKQVIFKIPEASKQFEQFIKIFEKPFKEILDLHIKSEFVKTEENSNKDSKK